MVGHAATAPAAAPDGVAGAAAAGGVAGAAGAPAAGGVVGAAGAGVPGVPAAGGVEVPVPPCRAAPPDDPGGALVAGALVCAVAATPRQAMARAIAAIRTARPRCAT